MTALASPRHFALPTLLIVCACGGPGDAPDHSRLRFTDVSSRSGIDLENVSGDPDRKTAIPESLGQGAAMRRR